MLLMSLSPATVCGELKPFLNLLGMIITAVKIIVPILLILFGMLDVGKSVVAGKPEEISKNIKSFAFRALAAVLIFFIPSIVGLIMETVAETGDADAKGWIDCKTYLYLN